MADPVLRWWPLMLRAHEREVSGEDICPWCGAVSGEPCGHAQDYEIPGCVTDGRRVRKDDEP